MGNENVRSTELGSAESPHARRSRRQPPTTATPLTALPPVTASEQDDDRLRPAILERGREASLSFVEGVTDAAAGLAGVQERLAEATQMPLLASAIRTQAHLTREISHAYARTTRQLLRR